MMTLHDLFSLVCHQDASRSYAIAGQVLPFCQRCTGLYLGLGLGLVTQWLTRSYRRGLPPGAAFYACLAGLLIMPVFGFHLLDPGPGWRLWSGLVYGDAIAWLLVPATFVLGVQGRLPLGPARRSTAVFWCQFAFVNSLPLWFPPESAALGWTVLSLACVGALATLACLAACLVFLLRNVLGRVLVKGDLHGSESS
jgi:hypothetical protein